MAHAMHTPQSIPPEEVLDRIVLRPSWRSTIPAVLLAAVAVGAARYLSIHFDVAPLHLPLSQVDSDIRLALPIALLLFLVLIVRSLVHLLDSRYVIGHHHLYITSGRLSFLRKLVEVPYEDMRGVRSEQGVFDRLIGIGDVVVWTASADSSAAVLRSVRDPDLVVQQVLHKIDEARLKHPIALPGQDMETQHRPTSTYEFVRPRSTPSNVATLNSGISTDVVHRQETRRDSPGITSSTRRPTSGKSVSPNMRNHTEQPRGAATR